MYRCSIVPITKIAVKTTGCRPSTIKSKQAHAHVKTSKPATPSEESCPAHARRIFVAWTEEAWYYSFGRTCIGRCTPLSLLPTSQVHTRWRPRVAALETREIGMERSRSALRFMPYQHFSLVPRETNTRRETREKLAGGPRPILTALHHRHHDYGAYCPLSPQTPWQVFLFSDLARIFDLFSAYSSGLYRENTYTTGAALFRHSIPVRGPVAIVQDTGLATAYPYTHHSDRPG